MASTKIVSITLLLLPQLFPAGAFTDRTWLPEVSMTTLEMIEFMGYVAENHSLVTNDGYILELHRIPKGKGQANINVQPVLLAHGLASSGATFVLNYPNQSLGYIMADHSYDVWLLNVRGSRYSRKHSWLTERDAKFWDFCLDDIAKFDLPAVIDYILQVSGQKGLFYVGYSMGASLGAALLSSLPNYNDKIRMMVYIGGTIFMEHTRGVAKEFTQHVLKLRAKLERVGPQFNSMFLKMTEASAETCKGRGVYLCQKIAAFYVGPFDDRTLNKTRMPVYLKHIPSGVSARSIIQFSQMITDKGEFRHYDWGERGNMEKYYQPEPPKYNLRLVTCPTYVMYSDGDFLSTAHDMAQIAKTQLNVVGQLRIEPLHFSHFDYIWSTSANERIYSKIISAFQSTLPQSNTA